MNSIVKKLSKQAHEYADNLCVYEPENSGLFEDKFAELIVQKCIILLVSKEGNENTSDAIWELEELGVDVAKALKKCKKF